MSRSILTITDAFRGQPIADRLLERRAELLDGWDQWVNDDPEPGQQCLLVDRRDPLYIKKLDIHSTGFLSAYLGLGGWYLSVTLFNDFHSREQIIAMLDGAIHYAKDHL